MTVAVRVGSAVLALAYLAGARPPHRGSATTPSREERSTLVELLERVAQD